MQCPVCDQLWAEAFHSTPRSLCECTKIRDLTAALRSLVIGVEELQAEWPHLDLPSEGRHNDLIGFLFATLPVAQKALKS